MKWIGLTGGLGTGKSTVAKLIREQGYIVLDADEIAKRVIAKGSAGLKSVREKFGDDFIRPDGELDRSKMAELVFRDPNSLLALESIIHPLVQQEVQQEKVRHHQSGAELLFYDVPLLFEKNIQGFDSVVVVTASEENQIRRLKQRNQWPDEEINRRMKNQMPLAEKEKKADHVIVNNGSLEELKSMVVELLNQLKN